jgi:hypothetical protein
MQHSISMTTLSTGALRIGRSTSLIHHRRTCTSFPSSRLMLCVAMMLCIGGVALSASPEPRTAAQRLGFANVLTARAAKNLGDPGSFVGGVVVRFFDRSLGRESFAITDKYGIALVPLRPGNYCGEALGTDGTKLRLEPRLNGGKPVCFAITADETKDVGIILAQDQEYKPKRD